MSLELEQPRTQQQYAGISLPRLPQVPRFDEINFFPLSQSGARELRGDVSANAHILQEGLPDPRSHHEATHTVVTQGQGSYVLSRMRQRNGVIIWALPRRDLSRYADYKHLNLQPALLRLDALHEVSITTRTFRRYIQFRRQLFRSSLESAIGRPDPNGPSEKEVEIKGRFYRVFLRRVSNRILWACTKTEFARLVAAHREEGIEPRPTKTPRFDRWRDLLLTGEGLSQHYQGGASALKALLKPYLEPLGSAAHCDSPAVSASFGKVSLEVYPIRTKIATRFATAIENRKLLQRALGIRPLTRSAFDPTTQIACSQEGLFPYLRGNPWQLERTIKDKIGGSAAKSSLDGLSFAVGNERLDFFRVRRRSRIIWTIPKSVRSLRLLSQFLETNLKSDGLEVLSLASRANQVSSGDLREWYQQNQARLGEAHNYIDQLHQGVGQLNIRNLNYKLDSSQLLDEMGRIIRKSPLLGLSMRTFEHGNFVLQRTFEAFENLSARLGLDALTPSLRKDCYELLAYRLYTTALDRPCHPRFLTQRLLLGGT